MIKPGETFYRVIEPEQLATQAPADGEPVGATPAGATPAIGADRDDGAADREPLP